MASERKSYRENLELLRSLYPEKLMFSISETMKATGLTYKVVKKNFIFNDHKLISICDLARQMSLKGS